MRMYMMEYVSCVNEMLQKMMVILLILRFAESAILATSFQVFYSEHSNALRLSFAVPSLSLSPVRCRLCPPARSPPGRRMLEVSQWRLLIINIAKYFTFICMFYK